MAGFPGCTLSVTGHCTAKATSGRASAFTGGLYARTSRIRLCPFFQQVVRNSYEGKLGLHDPDVTGYVAHLLCEFSQTDKFTQVRDEAGHPIEELESDDSGRRPRAWHRALVRRRARHAQVHRRLLAAVEAWISKRIRLEKRRRGSHPSLSELIHAGKESYFIVSQFNMFEYEKEAPFVYASPMASNAVFPGVVALVREELAESGRLCLRLS